MTTYTDRYSPKGTSYKGKYPAQFKFIVTPDLKKIYVGANEDKFLVIAFLKYLNKYNAQGTSYTDKYPTV